MRLSFDRLWVVVALGLPALLSLVVALPAVDLAYQVRAGNEIVSSAALPGVDTWTFTIDGAAWLDQQWLAQVVLALLHSAGGWELLAVVRASLVVAAIGLLLAAIVELGAPVRIAAVLSLVAFLLAAPALALRPQLFGIVIFTALLWLVASRHRRPVLYLLAPVLVALWANVHGSFALAPLVLGYALADDVVAGGPWRRSMVVLLAGTAATLVNPYGLEAWTYAYSIGIDPTIRSAVSEWQRTSPLTVPGALFYASVLAAAGFLFLQRGRRGVVRISDWLWLVGWTAIGAWAERGLAWWPFAAAFIVGNVVGRVRLAARTGPADDDIAASRRPRPNTLNGAAALLLGLLIVGALPWWRPVDPLTGRVGLLSYAPSSLAQAMRLAAAPGVRVYAEQTWASWLEWAVPDARYFLDSRFELFPASVFTAYGTIGQGGDAALAELGALGVGIVVVPTDEPLAATLEGAGWTMLLEDEEGVVFAAGAVEAAGLSPLRVRRRAG